MSTPDPYGPRPIPTTIEIRDGEPILPGPPPRRRRRQRPWLAPLLFVATILSTLAVGGPAFSAVLMLILTAHELGHYLQARRYRVPASLPMFIPMPLNPIGTMGAIIAMRAHVADRRALFDIAISGPLAGLVPALIASAWGLAHSQIVPTPDPGTGFSLGEPVVFQWLANWMVGPVPEGSDILLHPIAYAGWVGLFITALNLLPIGQLDGGHLLYSLVGRWAHLAAMAFVGAAAVGIAIFGYWGWTLMLVLIVFLGPFHPPTANDRAPLGRARRWLGWATLAFFPLGFTPTPFIF